jgi:hypothetical protein
MLPALKTQLKKNSIFYRFSKKRFLANNNSFIMITLDSQEHWRPSPNMYPYKRVAQLSWQRQA